MLQNDNAELIATAEQMTNSSSDSASTFMAGAKTVDSTFQSITDSVKNMGIHDLKAVVTGENTLIRDAMSELLDLTVAFLPKLLGTIVVLWVGFRLIRLLKRGLTKVLERRHAESTLKSFLTSLVDVLMKVMLVIMALDIIGIKATSFIAILGAAGLAVGMALQGTLQNFAGGVIILLMRPFKVGDYIECDNYKGYVKEIRIFHTIIRPFNGRIIIVPNSELATRSLINHTKEPVIRLDIECGVAYGSDLDKVRTVIQQVIDDEELILKDPAPKFCVSNLNESSVDYTLWLWIRVEDYWTVWTHIRENIYKAFNANNISIPFPQMDVHIAKEP